MIITRFHVPIQIWSLDLTLMQPSDMREDKSQNYIVPDFW